MLSNKNNVIITKIDENNNNLNNNINNNNITETNNNITETNNNITETNNNIDKEKKLNQNLSNIDQNNINRLLNNKENLNILNKNNNNLENKKKNIDIDNLNFNNIVNSELSDKEKYNLLKEKNDTKVEEKLPEFLTLDAGKWGYVSAVANFASVVFQLYTTFKTKKTKSFSILFLFLLTFLNLVYVFLGVLTENIGLVIACGVFVLYNLIIIYFYYFGK